MSSEPANDNKNNKFDVFDLIGIVITAAIIIWFKESPYFQAIVDWL